MNDVKPEPAKVFIEPPITLPTGGGVYAATAQGVVTVVDATNVVEVETTGGDHEEQA